MLMTRRFYVILAALLFVGILPLHALDVFLENQAETNVGKVKVVEVGSEPITLYDGNSASAKPTNYSNYGVGVCFKTDPGTKLILNFEEFDLKNINVFLYDKKVDAITYDYDWYDEYYEYTTPAGWLANYYSSKKPTEAFSSETGYLTVVWKPNGETFSGTGIKATVTAEAAGDMELVSTELFNGLTQAYAGQVDAPLYGLRLTTSKSLNPLKITSLEYSDATAGGNVSNVRLCTRDNAGVLTAVDPQGYELKSGKNEIFFVADVSPSAAEGTSLTPINITSLTIGTEEVVPDAASCTDITVKSDIIMPGDKAWPVVKVSTPRKFYDTGGVSGKIPLGSEGTITFLPAEAGKKVKIDFSDFGLFTASIASNSDVFRVYNGRAVDASKIIVSGTEAPGMVKSSDEEGALTLYYKCNAVSDYYAGKGWDATVSQFQEAPMTLLGVDAEAVSSEPVTVTEGESDVPMLYFNVRTADALNPKHLTGVKVTGTGNAVKGALYYLGGKKDAANIKDSNKSGEAVLAETEVALPADVTLSEGDNWFALTIDVAATAEDGETAGITVGGVLVDSSASVPEGTASASATIDNICRLTDGTHSHNISSKWTFTHNEHELYPGRYDTVQKDHVVTFKPATESGKIELNFSEFEVYYAAQSYGTRAKFEVRSGDRYGTVLWKVDSKDKSTSGPGVPLRSTAEDGSLTVVFNPNTNTRSYSAKGWMAEVREVVSKPMTITSTEVLQSPEGVSGVQAGSDNARLLDINIVAEGDTDIKTIKGLNLNLTGQSEIEKIYLLSSGAYRDFSKATVVGSAVPEAGKREVVIPCDIALADGDNRLWVTFDLADDVDSDIMIDAAVSGFIMDNDTELVIDNGDPEGYRLTQNIYVMEAGTKEVVVARKLQFYDDGGADGNISMSFNGTVTFVPARTGEAIRINTPEDGFGLGMHTMKIYNGRTISEETLIDTYRGASGPENVISTAGDGTLTVVVKTLSSPSVMGFHVEVDPFALRDLEASAPVVEGPGSPYVVRGGTRVPLLKAPFEVAGERNTVALTGVKAVVNAPEGVMSKAEVFLTSADMFVADKPLGEAVLNPSGEISFESTDGVEIGAAGTYYIWLTGDIAASASVDSKIQSSLTEVTIGAKQLIPVQDEAIELSIRAGLSGTYTLGKGGDYSTFSATTKALKDGIEGPVTFQVLDGTYPENIVLSDIRGTSAENRITFTSQSGNRAAVVVTGSMPSASNDEYGTHKEGMVLVERTPYVSFSSITFQPTQGMEYPSVMNIYDGSTDVTVDNCAFSGMQYYDPMKSGVKLIFVESPNEENHTCDNFSVTNSSFSGGYCALSLQGSGYVAHRRLQNMTVSGNTITNPYFQGIYANNVENLVITGNTIENRNQAKDDFRGIDIFLAGFRIEANKLVLSSDQVSQRGINIRKQGGGLADNPGMVVNNVIAYPSASEDFHHGIDIDASSKYVKFIHNTVVVNGTGGHPLGIEGNPSASVGLEFSANLLQNLGTGAALHISYPEYSEAVLEKISWAGNCYYGSTMVYTGEDASAMTFDQYKEKTGDETSAMEIINFATSTNLRPLDNAPVLEIARNPLVLVDADGRDRSETTSRGAYQYRPMSTDKPVMAPEYPVVKGSTVSSVTVAVKWNVPGDLYMLVLPASDAAPTAETLLSQSYREIQGDTEVLVTKELLNENTLYKAYFLMNTVLGGNSDVFASEEVRTLRDYTALAVVSPDDVTIQAGASATLSVSATGGNDDEPYAYEWYDQMMEAVGSDATLTVSPDVSSLYRVKVTSSDNQVAWGKVRVRVKDVPLAVATFEDVYLTSESSWRWDRNINNPGETDAFFSGSFEFANSDMRQYNTWGGFGYANETSNIYSDLAHQMRNAVGAGAASTRAYGVCSPYGMDGDYVVTVTNAPDGCVVPGVYVTNSALTLDAVLNGSATTAPFVDGDYLEVEIEGYDAAGSRIGRIIVPLADFRSGKSEIVNEWKYVNLKPLGEVRTLKFGCYSSQEPDLTRMFCLDQLGAADPGSSVEFGGADGVSLRLVADNVLSVSSASPCDLEIFTVAGQMVERYALDGSSAVGISALAPGVYIARVAGSCGDASLRFAKH